MAGANGGSLEPRQGGAPEATSASARDPLLPQTLSTLSEGYGAARLRRDAIAGLTVAIVALPLSMAIAIASGLPPERGLFTAIVAGFLISLLGGSRFQVGGPAGAFIVLIASVVERHGYDGLVLATIMAGGLLLLFGALRLGSWINRVPHPVIVAFTAGIAVIIFASQIRELLGLSLPREPAALLPKLGALLPALTTYKLAAVVLAAATIATILGLRRARPNWPGLLIAVALATMVAAVFQLDVATIGTRYGSVPASLPPPSLPAVSVDRLLTLLPDAIAIALLGAIESLLSAVVADGMGGGRHRSNMELVAQGAANIGASLFGGMPATGTIARTATNIRSGATSPISGMLHAVYLLVFMLLAAPLMAHIPLAALAGLLAVVSWNMAERVEFTRLVRQSYAGATVVLVTFLATIFVDLIVGIVAGVAIHALLERSRRKLA